MRAKNVWLAVAIIGSVWFFFKPKKPVEAEGADTPYNEGDVDALARMLFVETSFLHGDLESSAIINVALNRAKKYRVGIPIVVEPPGRPLTWNAHPTYAERYDQAEGSRRFAAGKELVRKILDGEIPNPIGNRIQFLHVDQMGACVNNSCAHKGNRWVCHNGRERDRRVSTRHVHDVLRGQTRNPVRPGAGNAGNQAMRRRVNATGESR